MEIIVASKPNILFILADDVGWSDISTYNHGIMGHRTPNIDRIGREGAIFTDFYGQPGVGKPTVTQFITQPGYATGQFGFVGSAIDFMQCKTAEGAPWFCCFGPTGGDLRTHPDADLDAHVGQLLKTLDDLLVADNTVVVFTTGNAEALSSPSSEDRRRVPFLMRWPGVLPPRRVINDICSLQDILPMLAAAAGEPHPFEMVRRR